MISIFSLSAWSHGGEKHDKSKSKLSTKPEHDNLTVIKKDNLIVKKINQRYLSRVKTILKKSCFDCQGSNTTYPWYYKIPGIKQVIDGDIREAKKHLDFSNDYPFKSHEMPINDLKAISDSIQKITMPPFAYRIMHSDKKLSKEEIKIIQEWIDNSINKLKEYKVHEVQND